MENFFNVEMKIGGKLESDNVDEFCQVLRNEGAYNKNRSANTTQIKSVSDLNLFINNGILTVINDNYPHEQMNALVEICERLNLPYDASTSKDNLAGKRSIVRPGQKKDVAVCNGNGDHIISCDDLQKEFGNRLEKINGVAPHELRRRLLRLLKLDVQKIPNFTIE